MSDSDSINPRAPWHLIALLVFGLGMTTLAGGMFWMIVSGDQAKEQEKSTSREVRVME